MERKTTHAHAHTHAQHTTTHMREDALPMERQNHTKSRANTQRHTHEARPCTAIEAATHTRTHADRCTRRDARTRKKTGHETRTHAHTHTHTHMHTHTTHADTHAERTLLKYPWRTPRLPLSTQSTP